MWVLYPSVLYPSITVLEPHDVMELRGGDLDDVAAVFARHHAVPGPGRDVVGVAAPEDPADQRAVLLHHQLHLAVGEVEGLVLDLVILEREGVAGVHVQDLAHVTVGVGEDQLIPPRLLHSANGKTHRESSPESSPEQGLSSAGGAYPRGQRAF